LRELRAVALRATALRATVSATTASIMDEDFSSADSLGPAITTTTMIIRTTPPTIPTMTMVAATLCDAVCIPPMAGVSGRFKSADNLQASSLERFRSRSIKVDDPARCGRNQAASVYFAPRPLSCVGALRDRATIQVASPIFSRRLPGKGARRIPRAGCAICKLSPALCIS
jgi:hypothetical protein